MRNGEDDGVEDGGALGAEGRYGGDQWRDTRLVSESSLHDDGCVRCPHADPQRDVHQGDFGDADLGALGVGVGVAPQRGHVHFSGLLAKCRLVLKDGANDVKVAVEDNGQRSTVCGQEEDQCERNGLLVTMSFELVVGFESV